jgi:hypothetical protein
MRLTTLGLLVSFGGNALAGSLVLCIGPDNHVALELAHASCCEGVVLPPSSAAGGFFGSGFEGCGPCQDLPIPSILACRRASGEGYRNPSPQALTAAHLLPWCPEPSFLPLSSKGASPVPSRGSLAHLKTTILRL